MLISDQSDMQTQQALSHAAAEQVQAGDPDLSICFFFLKVLSLSLLDFSSCANNPPEIDEVMELIKKT
jgi:hypothetical protein